MAWHLAGCAHMATVRPSCFTRVTASDWDDDVADPVVSACLLHVVRELCGQVSLKAVHGVGDVRVCARVYVRAYVVCATAMHTSPACALLWCRHALL